jgi:hypothetical protein
MPVDEKAEPREVNWRQLLPWTILFQGFRVALDPNKLLLAAAGLLTMSFLWWLTSVIFDYQKPKWPGTYQNEVSSSLPEAEKENEAWKNFKIDFAKWKVMHKAAGSTSSEDVYDANDFADSPSEWVFLNDQAKLKELPPVPADVKSIAQIEQMEKDGKIPDKVQVKDDKISDKLLARAWKVKLREPRPAGQLRTLPWSEDRGPNPYMLVTGQAPRWEKGHFLEWMVTEQVPVLMEPLFKLFRPLVFFFDSKAGGLTRFYCILLLLWTILVWGLFGGAITRIAAVQVTRQEKVGLFEALRFTAKRYVSYISAPIFPILAVGVLVILMMLFGLVHMIPGFGEVIDALLWFLMILCGLGMAVILVGLVGWPLMSATISTEGTDSWEAVSRSYSYVYQAPWQYIWYTLVATVYGAVIIFFVGFMGSFMVYLSKWGVSQTPGIDMVNRNPAYLFAYAPESFGWRTLLLQGATVEGQQVVENGEIQEGPYKKLVGDDPNYPKGSKDRMTIYNQGGAAVVSVVWIGLIFMLVVGFGYSYFWSASTIIYLLMRRKVDDAELDEVYLEEEEPYSGPLAGAPKAAEPPSGPSSGIRPAATSPVAGPASLPMVDLPRPAAVPATPPPVAEVPRPSPAPPPVYTPQPATPTPSSEPLHSEPSGHVPEPPKPAPPPSPPISEGPTAPSGNGEN